MNNIVPPDAMEFVDKPKDTASLEATAEAPVPKQKNWMKENLEILANNTAYLLDGYQLKDAELHDWLKAKMPYTLNIKRGNDGDSFIKQFSAMNWECIEALLRTSFDPALLNAGILSKLRITPETSNKSLQALEKFFPEYKGITDAFLWKEMQIKFSAWEGLYTIPHNHIMSRAFFAGVYNKPKYKGLMQYSRPKNYYPRPALMRDILPYAEEVGVLRELKTIMDDYEGIL